MRLQLSLKPQTVDRIEYLRQRLGASSKADVIKSSIQYYDFLLSEKEKDKNLKILLKDRKGKIKELAV